MEAEGQYASLLVEDPDGEWLGYESLFGFWGLLEDLGSAAYDERVYFFDTLSYGLLTFPSSATSKFSVFFDTLSNALSVDGFESVRLSYSRPF